MSHRPRKLLILHQELGQVFSIDSVIDMVSIHLIGSLNSKFSIMAVLIEFFDAGFT